MSYDKGTCRYCGQIIDLGFPYMSEEDADEAAAKLCSCPGSLAWAALQEQIERGIERVHALFGEECEEYGFEPVDEPGLIQELEVLVERVARGQIFSASISSKYGKAGIGKTSKGLIKVTRSETRAYQLEE